MTDALRTPPGGPAPEGALAAHVEEALRAWIDPERKRLTQLLAQGPLGEEAAAAELSRITEAAARTLAVERASVWRLAPDGRSITSVDLFEQGPSRHSSGTVILESAAPQYFRALARERAISAHDACADPRTADFRSSYLEPLGITSMLDAPVFAQGRAVAVLCHEHVGPMRRWQAWEELVAGTLADFAGLIFEARARQAGAARSPEQERAEARIRDLVAGEEALRALIDESPVPQVLSRASEQVVLYANRRALELFQTTAEAMVGSSAAGYWMEPAARHEFLERVLRDGRVVDLEVRLRSARGHAFWARLTAEAVTFKGELALLTAAVDITAQRRAEENLRNVFAHAPVGLVVSRLADMVLLEANERARALFELEVERGRGMPAPNFWAHPADRDNLLALAREKGSVSGFEAELRTHTGKQFWAELSAGIIDFDEAPALLVGVNDVTERKRAQDALRKMAITDALTGVYNRRHFFELAAAELARAERYRRPTSVAMLDLDHFKAINDALGHARGDLALKNVVAAVQPLLRETDVLARYGGEEFCLLFPETALEAAARTAERVRAAVAASPFDSGEGNRRVVTVSVGVAQLHPGEPLDALLRRADLALYAAKEQGRDRVVARP